MLAQNVLLQGSIPLDWRFVVMLLVAAVVVFGLGHKASAWLSSHGHPDAGERVEELAELLDVTWKATHAAHGPEGVAAQLEIAKETAPHLEDELAALAKRAGLGRQE